MVEIFSTKAFIYALDIYLTLVMVGLSALIMFFVVVVVYYTILTISIPFILGVDWFGRHLILIQIHRLKSVK